MRMRVREREREREKGTKRVRKGERERGVVREKERDITRRNVSSARARLNEPKERQREWPQTT